MDTLIFIDTNIFLDFYRMPASTGLRGLSMLDHIDKNKDIIITNSQVEMEYKKNRQKIIIESLKTFKTPDASSLSVPAFMAVSKNAKSIAKHKDNIIKQQEKVRNRVGRILENPSLNDPVYKKLQRLFKYSSPYNLTREKKDRIRIRDLAEKRFILGYPPRKNKDTSIGDAINWEWIVDCAKKYDKHIIIVSRDSDYGIMKDKPLLNDWLRQEFKERVSRKRKIILTNKLSEAFEEVKVPLTKEEKLIEEKLIEEKELDSAKEQAFDFMCSLANIDSKSNNLSYENLYKMLYGEYPEKNR